MRELTSRQKEVATFIEKFIEDKAYSPTVRDVAEHFGFSPKAAYDHLSALKKKGIIKSDDNIPRSLVVTKSSGNSENAITKIPVLGVTAAGRPILSEEVNDGYISLSSSLVGNYGSSELYAMRIHGDSMIEDGINDGDLAILSKTNEAHNGEIVAASIGDEEDYGITLKHFYRHQDRYELRPGNKAYESYYSTHCQIHGKLVMILRNY